MSGDRSDRTPPNLLNLAVDTDACTTCNSRYAKVSRGLAQTSPIGSYLPGGGAISTSDYLPHPWTQLTHHPKQHPDPISHFPHPPDRPTDRPTDGPGDKTCTNTPLCCINERNADNEWSFYVTNN